MATTPALLTIEQYLHTSYKPDVHIDPQERLAYTFAKAGLQWQEDLVLRVSGTEIAMDVHALFAELDRKKNRMIA